MRMTDAPAVYVVDDDPLVTDSLSRALELETPWRVHAFNDGARALANMSAAPPDVVLSDFKMPGMDGIAFLRKVRAQFPDAVLMLITGYADKESAIRAINELGIWQYVEKPWDLGDLIVKIRQGLERRALTDELRKKNAALEARLAELERAHDELVRAERLAAVGRVASGLAHEIGNQLALVGYAEEIRDRSKDPELAEFARVIISAQRRLAALVDEIKDFARGANSQYAREPGDVAAAVEEALGILRFDADVKARRVSLDVAKRPLALLHRGKIAQVIVNLVRNAVQASPAGGEVRVAVDELARDGKREAIVTVSDRGQGMAPDVLARIGEPFFTTKDRGSGLGLGITRRIVQEHGGTIDVRSSAGEGTEVTVRLPAIA